MEPSKNPWDTFYYLMTLKPRPSKFKPGDICKVTDRKHTCFGKEARVVYASGEYIELTIGCYSFHAKPDELKWMGHTRTA